MGFVGFAVSIDVQLSMQGYFNLHVLLTQHLCNVLNLQLDLIIATCNNDTYVTGLPLNSRSVVSVSLDL